MDVLAPERAYWEAMKNDDSEGVEKLTDESCIVVGPEGIGEFDPKTAGAMLDDMPYELQSYEIGRRKGANARTDVALVAYPVPAGDFPAFVHCVNLNP